MQGHVDNVGVVTEKYMDGESLRVRMQAPKDLAPYIVKKGYISIDGTSLTITEADPTTGIFAIMLVTHTQRCIVLPTREIGDRVNLGAPSPSPLPSTAPALILITRCFVDMVRRGRCDDEGRDGGCHAGPGGRPARRAEAAHD